MAIVSWARCEELGVMTRPRVFGVLLLAAELAGSCIRDLDRRGRA